MIFHLTPAVLQSLMGSTITCAMMDLLASAPVAIRPCSPSIRFANGGKQIGIKHYPDAQDLLILADCGGSNGYRPRLWKYQLQHALCNRFGMTVKVCHYPPGSSKWNLIEHRMFSFISMNWAAQPLLNYETVLNFITTTKTEAGLNIQSSLNDTVYTTGIKITDRQFQALELKRHTQRPNWNYSICPSRT